MDEIIDCLDFLIEECRNHNSDYHHFTPKATLDEAEKLVNWLRQVRGSCDPTAHGEKVKRCT